MNTFYVNIHYREFYKIKSMSNYFSSVQFKINFAQKFYLKLVIFKISKHRFLYNITLKE